MHELVLPLLSKGWQLVVDSREQNPLDVGVNFKVDMLPIGDYGLIDPEGKLFPLVIERKSIPDLFKTLSKDYKRFMREALKARDHGIKLVLLIEGNRSAVEKGILYSKRPGSAVIRQVNTLFVKYGIPYMYARSREEAAQLVEDVFYAVLKNWRVKKIT